MSPPKGDVSPDDGNTTLATSQEIRDRGSAFVGYIYRAQTADAVRVAIRDRTDENEKKRNASHAGRVEGGDGEDKGGLCVIAAWRCMAVKPGRTGLGGPDEFVVEQGYEDGGERWAGKRVLEVMMREGVLDAVVVVCRWFGGTLLGPVRFTHIETCAGEVCRRFKKIEEMEECVQTLETLDGLLAALRAEYTSMRNPSSGLPEKWSKAPDYQAMQDGLDLAKAKRLIHARECAINNTKTLIEKYKTST